MPPQTTRRKKKLNRHAHREDLIARQGRYFRATLCHGFHGSPQAFEEFDPELGRYDDQALCLSASPLVAGVYGKYIYSCTVSNVCLRVVTVTQWFGMSSAKFERHLKSELDGLLILPEDASAYEKGEEAIATFSAETMVLWNISKCRIQEMVRLSDDLSSGDVAAFLLGTSRDYDNSGTERPRTRFDEGGKSHWTGVYFTRRVNTPSHRRPSEAILELVQAFHNRQRLEFSFDFAKSTYQLVVEILHAARVARKEGAIAQYLVGAKLQLRYPELQIENNSVTTADAQLGRAGDFLVGDTAFHITVAPMPPVLDRCRQNLANGLCAYLLVSHSKLEAARQMAAESLGGKIAILSIESFVSQNIDEIGQFRAASRAADFARLLNVYNTRVDAVENDKSHLIDIPRNLVKAS